MHCSRSHNAYWDSDIVHYSYNQRSLQGIQPFFRRNSPLKCDFFKHASQTSSQSHVTSSLPSIHKGDTHPCKNTYLEFKDYEEVYDIENNLVFFTVLYCLLYHFLFHLLHVRGKMKNGRYVLCLYIYTHVYTYTSMHNKPVYMRLQEQCKHAKGQAPKISFTAQSITFSESSISSPLLCFSPCYY